MVVSNFALLNATEGTFFSPLKVEEDHQSDVIA
jgi:hypothetical protein